MKFIFAALLLGNIESLLAVVGNDVCTPYEQFESQVHCGSDGYLIHFGYRNCLNFQNNVTRSRYSPRGREFLDCTTSCLINYLNQLFGESTKPSCDKITSSAFDSHVSCYIQCGFCDICKTEKYAMARGYFIKDFLSFAAFKQALAVIKHCGVFSCFNFLSGF